MCLMFFKPSSNAQYSFATAMQRLGGSVISINSQILSIKTDESLEGKEQHMFQ